MRATRLRLAAPSLALARTRLAVLPRLATRPLSTGRICAPHRMLGVRRLSSSHLDPYKVLGVQPGASESEIKAAYRKQAMKYHPDRNAGDPAAEQKFKDVSAAYAQLSGGGGGGGGGSSGGFGGGPGFGGGFGGGGGFSNEDAERLFREMMGGMAGGGFGGGGFGGGTQQQTMIFQGPDGKMRMRTTTRRPDGSTQVEEREMGAGESPFGFGGGGFGGGGFGDFAAAAAAAAQQQQRQRRQPTAAEREQMERMQKQAEEAMRGVVKEMGKQVGRAVARAAKDAAVNAASNAFKGLGSGLRGLFGGGGEGGGGEKPKVEDNNPLRGSRRKK